MTINIKGTDYKVKQTIRSLFIWEQITERQFEIKSLLDNYLYFYCLLLANNEDFMSWNEFINALDEDPRILIQMGKLLENQNEIEKLFESDEEDSDGKKKRLNVSELYAILTLHLGFDAEYVMDKMQMYEVSALMRYSYHKHKEDWEQARLISYLIAQTNSTKKLKIDDIIKFTWEKEQKNEKQNMDISQEEIEMLTKKAMEMEKTMFGQQ